jgi:hypothetical protein
MNRDESSETQAKVGLGKQFEHAICVQKICTDSDR